MMQLVPCLSALSPATAPAGAGSSLVSPALLFVLAVAGGLGMVLLLPGRKETPIRWIGGVILLAVLLVLGVVLGRATAGPGAFFWIFAAIALVAAVRVITHTKPVYSALYFVLTVMASAGLFVLMWAEFMAAALILIYAGAILVTYVFVIMLAAEAAPAGQYTGTGAQYAADHDQVSREPLFASAIGFALMGVLLLVVFDRGQLPPVRLGGAPATQPAVQGATQQLAVYLFNRQLVNLELAGLILTVSMVGAILIARRRVFRTPEGDAAQDAVVAPMTPISDDPHSIPVLGTENPRQKEYPET